MRSVAPAALAAAALVLALAAPAFGAELTVPRTCYAEGDRIPVDGRGFTPSGKVRLSLERADGTVLEATDDPVAEPDGSVSGGYGVDNETGWFDRTQSRFQMTMRLVDQTDTSITASTSFIFSRWSVGVRTVGGRIHPSRPVSLNPVGYTTAIGKPLYGHWMRNGRRAHTRRLGVLRGPCGDLRTRLKRGFPFRPVLPGRYEVRFSTSRTNTRREAIGVRAATVARRIP
ncbi:MAG: hypothetical protein M3320_03140 [Actinomycetota bacterium]|nr:hypothetical protein [Actinomycetota bacterium]MDQ5807649.1 hypothetical protein [Actinomycetota bacterium]